MNQELYIVRGLPGSGKSTLAAKLASNAHYEADQFRYKDGVYVFNPADTAAVHEKCYEAVKAAIMRGEPKIAVSNTFVQRWEYEKYIQLAREFRIKFTIIKCTGTWQNVHGVDEVTMDRMRSKWQSDKREQEARQ